MATNNSINAPLGTGVATFLATPSSANLATAVTNETGSGALVFATSPTLVTPVLGTPTSGNLINCTGAGDWVKISSATASSSATIDFTGLTSTYAAYLVVINGLLPATNAVMLQARISIASSFSSSALYSLAQQGTGASTVAGRVTSATQWNIIDSTIFGSLANTAGLESSWRIWLNNPAATTVPKTIGFEGDHLGSSTTASFIRGSGFYQSNSAVDGIRFFMSSGNITTGIFTLYGLKA